MPKLAISFLSTTPLATVTETKRAGLMAGDRSIHQLAFEFNVAKSSVSKWANEYREECLYTTDTTSESNDAKEIRRLNQLLNEKDKEIAFLKKQRRSLRRKSISGISIH